MNTFLSRAALFASALFVLLSPPAFAQQSKLDEVVARGKVIAGVSSESPPFGFVDDKGELVGFDIDIARLIAKVMFGDANKVELFRQPFSARWANVQNGTIDFGIQVTTIYPDRLLRVAFTRPYIDSGTVVIVRKDSPLKSVSDLNSEKVTVAHAASPAHEDRGKRYYPKAKIVVLDSIAAQFNAVKIGRTDAVQLDSPVAFWYAKSNDDVRILEGWMGDVNGDAIFLKQGDFKWWHFLDALVGEMTGGSLYGEYSAIYKKWFGILPPNPKVPSTSAAQSINFARPAEK